MTTEATEAKPAAMTRDELTKLAKVRYASYETPSGKRIVFSSLRRSVLYAIEAQFFNEDGKPIESLLNTRPSKIMAAVLCDGTGKRMFRDDEWEKVDAIPSEIFEPLWTAVRKHLGMNTVAKEEDAAEAPND